MLMLVLNAFIVFAVAAIVVMFVANMFTWKRVGGLVHFRCGRFGGSFYLAKAKPKAKRNPDDLAFGVKRRFPRLRIGFGVNADQSTLAQVNATWFRFRMESAVRNSVRAEIALRVHRYHAANYHNQLTFA